MTSPRTATPSPAADKRLIGPLGITLLAIGVLVVLFVILSQTLTEVWWYQQLGYATVLWTQWGTQAVLFVIGFAVMAIVLHFSARLAYQRRRVYAPSAVRSPSKEQYREALEPFYKVISYGIPALFGLFGGISAAGQWREVQTWLHQVSFGETDPIFGNDLAFYVFTMPVLHYALGYLTVVLVLGTILAAFMHYVYDGIRLVADPQQRKVTLETSKAARLQLSIMAAAVMLAVAGHYWLARYDTLTSASGDFYGASYTDVHAIIPSQTILFGVALFVAALLVYSGIRGGWKLPALGAGLMILTAILVGGVYPAIVQRFTVQPNAQEFEQPYIQNNIDATIDAYGLQDIETQVYPAKTDAEAGALRNDAETTTSIRLLDPTLVSPAFRQLQQNKQYYNFAQTLSVDKYAFNDASHDTVIAARELDLTGLSPDQRNWVNEHMVFTHGYGLVAAYGNQVTSDGRPSFFESDIPSVGELSDLSGDGYEARIYFSPKVPEYSIVGTPDGVEPWELDYPDDTAEGQVRTAFPTQEISGGPSVGNLFARALYATKFRSEEILFSSRVTEVSQIMYDRDPSERVKKVAPYLTLDGRVYPTVVDGKVLWIVDGYTTTSQYPYSALQELDSATTDSLTASSSSIQALPSDNINYIRNSVKATVDAYTGEVTLYAWDPEDPILQTWQNVFPSTLKPISEISSELMSHIRYPEDLFKVQRSVLTKYHVTSATEFFTAQDFWNIPADPTTKTTTEGTASTVAQPPYYVTLQMPGQEKSAFSLTTTFIPGGSSGRQNLTGFLAANGDAGSVAGQPDADYGKLRLLTLPPNSTVPGPGQVQNAFDTDSNVAEILTYLKQGNSEVQQGNLLTLPVGGGLLYVQPVYAQAKQGTQYPLLRYVMAAFGDKVSISTTLSGALDDVFEGDSGAQTSGGDGAPDGEDPDAPTTDPSQTPEPSDTATPTPSATATATAEPGSGDPRADLDAALSDMRAAVEAGDKALADGDFAAYGTAQDALQEALDRAFEAQSRLG